MTDQLFEEWRAYQKLLENDYMDHRAFFGRLLEEIEARFDRPLALLDLGCGDAQPILPMLESLDVCRYTGIDESATALSRARELLGWEPAYGGLEGFRRGLPETVAWFTDPVNLGGYKADRYNL